MNKRNFFLSALGAVFIICQLVNAQDTSRSLTFNMVELTKRYVAPDTTESCCAGVDFKYPEFLDGTNESALRAINGYVAEYWVRDVGVDNIDALATSRLENFRQYHAQYRHESVGWSDHYTVAVRFNQVPLLTLTLSQWAMTGGAHPNHRSHSRLFSTETGEVLKLGDLLVEGFEDSLNTIGECVFRKVRGLGDTPMSETGFFSRTGEFALNDNFAVTTDGLMFYFNEYEINGYAAGGTKVPIPYEDILGLIKADGPLVNLIE